MVICRLVRLEGAGQTLAAIIMSWKIQKPLNVTLEIQRLQFAALEIPILFRYRFKRLPKLKSISSTIMVFEMNLTISVQTDCANKQKYCPQWTTNPKTEERCDAVTQLLHIWIISGGRYLTVYRSFAGWWFLAGNRCVLTGTEIVAVLDRPDQNLTGMDFCCYKSAGLILSCFAHKWLKNL